jgi:hypothetical protein
MGSRKDKKAKGRLRIVDLLKQHRPKLILALTFDGRPINIPETLEWLNMKILRSENLGVSLVAMILVAAIIATLLGTSTVFYHSEWLALTGLALFVLAGMPVLRALMGTGTV